MLASFVRTVCGCSMSWTPGAFIDETVACDPATGRRREGTVCAQRRRGQRSRRDVDRAGGGRQLTCVFVDNGLLRQDEARGLIEVFADHIPGTFVHVDATDRFLDR